MAIENHDHVYKRTKPIYDFEPVDRFTHAFGTYLFRQWIVEVWSRLWLPPHDWYMYTLCRYSIYRRRCARSWRQGSRNTFKGLPWRCSRQKVPSFLLMQSIQALFLFIVFTICDGFPISYGSHFLRFEVDNKQITVSAIQSNGTVFDRFQRVLLGNWRLLTLLPSLLGLKWSWQ